MRNTAGDWKGVGKRVTNPDRIVTVFEIIRNPTEDVGIKFINTCSFYFAKKNIVRDGIKGSGAINLNNVNCSVIIQTIDHIRVSS